MSMDRESRSIPNRGRSAGSGKDLACVLERERGGNLCMEGRDRSLGGVIR